MLSRTRDDFVPENSVLITINPIYLQVVFIVNLDF